MFKNDKYLVEWECSIGYDTPEEATNYLEQFSENKEIIVNVVPLNFYDLMPKFIRRKMLQKKLQYDVIVKDNKNN